MEIPLYITPSISEKNISRLPNICGTCRKASLYCSSRTVRLLLYESLLTPKLQVPATTVRKSKPAPATLAPTLRFPRAHCNRIFTWRWQLIIRARVVSTDDHASFAHTHDAERALRCHQRPTENASRCARNHSFFSLDSRGAAYQQMLVRLLRLNRYKTHREVRSAKGREKELGNVLGAEVPPLY